MMNRVRRNKISTLGSAQAGQAHDRIPNTA